MNSTMATISIVRCGEFTSIKVDVRRRGLVLRDTRFHFLSDLDHKPVVIILLHGRGNCRVVDHLAAAWAAWVAMVTYREMEIQKKKYGRTCQTSQVSSLSFPWRSNVRVITKGHGSVSDFEMMALAGRLCTERTLVVSPTSLLLLSLSS